MLKVREHTYATFPSCSQCFRTGLRAPRGDDKSTSFTSAALTEIGDRGEQALFSRIRDLRARGYPAGAQPAKRTVFHFNFTTLLAHYGKKKTQNKYPTFQEVGPL